MYVVVVGARRDKCIAAPHWRANENNYTPGPLTSVSLLYRGESPARHTSTGTGTQDKNNNCFFFCVTFSAAEKNKTKAKKRIKEGG